MSSPCGCPPYSCWLWTRWLCKLVAGRAWGRGSLSVPTVIGIGLLALFIGLRNLSFPRFRVWQESLSSAGHWAGESGLVCEEPPQGPPAPPTTSLGAELSWGHAS